jgi:MoaA/NifB/PqqE/SkfB family radical SAM enzyme
LQLAWQDNQLKSWAKHTLGQWRPLARWSVTRNPGYIDTLDLHGMTGWAHDPGDPDRPAVIQVFLEHRCVWQGKADLYREDMERLGVRSGRCGFSIPLESIPRIRRKQFVEVRIDGVEDPLTYDGASIIALPERPVFETIALDIVNNCNLRCPFCVVDYSRIKTTEVMSDDTFLRAIKLCEGVGDGRFLLSCLHEPTLHPRFKELLGMLPENRTQRFYFTTNLAKPLKDDMFEAWANSGIQYIQISIDSLDPEVFPMLRKFGRLKVFEDNLHRMVRIFRQHPNPPKLRYITMAFKSNMGEVPDLVRKTGELYLSSEHEIRYTYNMEHIQDEFRKTQYLTPADWETLSGQLEQIPYKHMVVTPPPTPEDIVEVFPSANYSITGTSRAWYGGKVVRPVVLRILMDGTVMLGGHENRWSVNVSDMSDPQEFFENMNATAWLNDLAPETRTSVPVSGTS